MIRAADLLALLSHWLKVLRLTYESFFNHATWEQRNDADSSNNVSECLRKWSQINFSYFRFRSQSRDRHGERSDEKCVWSSTRWKARPRCRCMNNARIHVLYGCVHIALRRRLFKWSMTVAKNDWSIPQNMIEQGHGVFIWWPRIVSLTTRTRDEWVIGEARTKFPNSKDLQKVPFIFFEILTTFPSRSVQIVRYIKEMRVIIICDVDSIRSV